MVLVNLGKFIIIQWIIFRKRTADVQCCEMGASFGIFLECNHCARVSSLFHIPAHRFGSRRCPCLCNMPTNQIPCNGQGSPRVFHCAWGGWFSAKIRSAVGSMRARSWCSPIKTKVPMKETFGTRSSFTFSGFRQCAQPLFGRGWSARSRG